MNTDIPDPLSSSFSISLLPAGLQEYMPYRHTYLNKDKGLFITNKIKGEMMNLWISQTRRWNPERVSQNRYTPLIW